MPSRPPSASRRAWPSAMPPSPARWWTSMCRSPRPDTLTWKRPCLASCSSRWSTKPWPVSAAGAPGGGASRSTTTRTLVSLVTLSTAARLATGGLRGEHALQGAQEGVVLLGQAGGDPEAALQAGQVVLASDDDPALEEPGVDGARVIDPEQHEVRDAGEDLDPGEGPQSGGEPLALGHHRGHALGDRFGAFQRRQAGGDLQ